MEKSTKTGKKETMTDKVKAFSDLRKIDVSEHIEKKNGLSYLSWAWAVDTLLTLDPGAEWDHPENTVFPDETVMVYCIVKAFGKPRKAHLPVMDYKNQAVKNPNAFQINTAMQRCLVKAIAMHGIGLYIYAGEDLPDGEEKTNGHAKPVNGKKSCVAEGNHRSGNKVIDKAVNEALGYINDALDAESAIVVGRNQWKLLKESGAHEDQLAMIQQQVENHCQFLNGKGVPA